jgi:predicted TIM-barrel fold metal-dependent hydrolase
VLPGKLIDMHSHWGTKRGYALRTPEELALQEKTWRSQPSYHTDEEMVAYFRESNVQTVLDFGFTKYVPVEEAREYHDYGIETQRRYPDVVLGNWIHVNPKLGAPAVAEFKRVLEARAGFTGLAVSASGSVPANDSLWEPFYAVCMEARVPALIFVGTTGLGSGLPGGGGIRLETCHPRYLDDVAAAHPELTIVAARPAWPWQTEMIAIMLHKPNVWYEVHGWSPRHFTQDLKYEISRRLQDRVMFGADYPLFRYQRLVDDWVNDGYKPEILEKVFHQNAERFFASLQS